MSQAHILVVDDEEDVEALVVQKFRRKIRAGEYEFVFARDGEDALEVLEKIPEVDLVLSDINMPRMDGLALLDRLHEQSRDLKVVMVSAYHDMRNIRTAMNRGAFDFVTKPIEFDDLEAVVEKTLHQLEEERARRRDEIRLLEITSAIASELDLDELLTQIMSATTSLLSAERSTLFLYDESKNVLWSRVAEGLARTTITIKAGEGIAGQAFQKRETINLTDVHGDSRFDSRFDRDTGFQTRSMLTMPFLNKDGRAIGVMQVLNKVDGVFTQRDERRLRTLSAQAAVAIENARLFQDVLNMRNYNEGILQSLSNGVISLDPAGVVEKANAAASRILNLAENQLVGIGTDALFGDGNSWILDAIGRVAATGDVDHALDTELASRTGMAISVNLTVVPLTDVGNKPIGNLLVFEDISAEKRVRSTMARYLPKTVVDRMLDDGGDALGGVSQVVTVLFSDIRDFTTISEAIGPRATVTMLNEYFAEMVEGIDRNGGILDKYIGDAIMALFGVPYATDDDVDNAVRAALEMVNALAALNERRATRGEDSIDIGIGLNTGEVVVGNIGTPRRLDYTAIGDTVNLAARLESATKLYGALLLVSESTYAAMSSTMQEGFREVDQILVKGKARPVSVYQGLAHTVGVRPSDSRALMEIDARGIAAYRARDWGNAHELFSQSLAMAPANRVANVYLKRIEHYRRHDPGPEWDGVWIMKSK